MPQDSPDRALVETQNWASRSHRELYDAVHIANDPGRVGQLADEWSKLGKEMADDADRMSEKLRSTESGWQGEAADAARAAIQKLADWSRDAGDSAGALAERVSEQGRIMETAKAEMPEPVKGGEEIHARAASTFATGDLESFTKAMDDLHTNQERSSSAHEQAVRVMARMEESSRTVDGDTPRFTQPPDPIEELKTRSATTAASASSDSAGNSTGPAQTQQQSAPGAEATQKMTRPASVGQQPSAPPLAAQTGPAGTGPDGAPLAAHTGPAGANAPTKRMQIPKIGGSNSVDGPTVRASPVKPASAGPSSQKPPSLQDYKPQDTNPQNATTFQGGDRQNEKTQKLRPTQGPDGVGSGPGGRRPGPNNRDGDRERRGQVPPIPPTHGPDGQIPPIGKTSAASGGSFGGAGATPPPMPSSGGAAGGSMAPGGMTGAGGAPGADHGGSGSAPSGGSGGAQPGASGAGGMMGGGAMGGAMGNRGGQGGQDEERKAKYVEGGPVVEVPGKDLPPPVIGEGKKKKKSQE